MKIAVDAMGGDHAPEEIVKGVLEALEQYKDVERVFFVGQTEAIEPLLADKNRAKIEIVPAAEVIDHFG